MCPQADLLKEIPLFQLMDEKEREELASHLELERFSSGDVIFQIGDPGDALFIINTGEVEVFFKNDTGERIVLERACKGDFFGELAFLAGGSRNASVVSLSDTEIFRLNKAHLESFLAQRPHAAMHLLTAMGRRLCSTAERLRHTASRNVNEETEDSRTVVQKVTDSVAEFTGSIPFLIIHAVLFTVWIVWNTVPIPGIPQFDPYPFGLLTLCVSLEAIFLSVFVLLSQNRQAAKERVRADIEYDVNLKAELEIAHLHEKLDHLNSEMLVRLEKLQSSLAAKSEQEWTA